MGRENLLRICKPLPRKILAVSVDRARRRVYTITIRNHSIYEVKPMIFATDKDFERCRTFSPALARALDFIAGKDWLRAAYGRYEIPGCGAYVNCSRNTQREDNPVFEAHRRYIDLQYIVQGDEVIRWAHTDRLAETQAYSEADDYALFRGEAQAELRLHAGDWAVFFPEDAHAPCIRLDSETCLKLVVKLPIEEF